MNVVIKITNPPLLWYKQSDISTKYFIESTWYLTISIVDEAEIVQTSKISDTKAVSV